MTTPTSTPPGFGPQVPDAERVLGTSINPTNSWAAAMALVQPQAGLARTQTLPPPERKTS